MSHRSEPAQIAKRARLFELLRQGNMAARNKARQAHRNPANMADLDLFKLAAKKSLAATRP